MGTSGRKSVVNKAFDALMDDVCVGLGYCGWSKDGKPQHVTDFIPALGNVSADQFVAWVIRADNLEPRTVPRKHKAAIKAAFIKRMGSELVAASRLSWTLPSKSSEKPLPAQAATARKSRRLHRHRADGKRRGSNGSNE